MVILAVVGDVTCTMLQKLFTSMRSVSQPAAFRHGVAAVLLVVLPLLLVLAVAELLSLLLPLSPKKRPNADVDLLLVLVSLGTALLGAVVVDARADDDDDDDDDDGCAV